MSPVVPLPEELRRGPFRTSTAAALGVSARVLTGRRFVRLFRDVYVVREIADDPWTRPDGALLIAPHAVLGHATAARAWALPVPELVGRTVHLLVPPGSPSPRRPGLAVHETSIPSVDIAVREGRRVAVPGRVLADLAGDWTLADLVALGDVAAARGLLDQADLLRRVDSGAGRRGVATLRRAAVLLDPSAPSATSSRLRVLLVTAGLPPPVHVDLDRVGWPDHGVMLEADEIDLRLRPDVLVSRTWDLLRAHGWEPSLPRPATHDAMAALGVFRTAPRWGGRPA